MQHQASHGDADHDPWKHSDEELAYLYAQLPPKHSMPVNIELPTSDWVKDLIRLLSN